MAVHLQESARCDPVAEALAVEPGAPAGEDLGLAVVGQVADEVGVKDLGDELGGAMQQSCKEGGSGATTGLASGSPLRTYLQRSSRMRRNSARL